MKAFCNKLSQFFTQFLLVFFIITNASQALSPESKLENENLENRAMNLFLNIRCVVCNGQVIENSDTKFAFDMRELVRQKIVEGKSDEEIKQYLVANFGEDILNEPSKNGLLLFLLLPAITSFVIFIFFFKNNAKFKKYDDKV